MVSVGSNYVTFVIIPLPFAYIDIFLSSVGTRQPRKPKAKLPPPKTLHNLKTTYSCKTAKATAESIEINFQVAEK